VLTPEYNIFYIGDDETLQKIMLEFLFDVVHRCHLVGTNQSEIAPSITPPEKSNSYIKEESAFYGSTTPHL
jgi:hypothetical protein